MEEIIRPKLTYFEEYSFKYKKTAAFRYPSAIPMLRETFGISLSKITRLSFQI